MFNSYRISSVTRPGMGAGLTESYLGFFATADKLKELTAEMLSFFVDKQLIEYRGDEVKTEEFMLQGGVYGRDWVDIKPIKPVVNDSDVFVEPDYGTCADCPEPLEESDFAVGVLCTSCREKAFEDADTRAEIAEEERSERMLFAGDYI